MQMRLRLIIRTRSSVTTFKVALKVTPPNLPNGLKWTNSMFNMHNRLEYISVSAILSSKRKVNLKAIKNSVNSMLSRIKVLDTFHPYIQQLLPHFISR
jgi:hypothetical protein